MREKKLSLWLVVYLFCFVVILSVTGCGSDSAPSKKTTMPEDLLNNPSPVENPKTNVGIKPSLVLGKDDLLRISYYDKTNGDLKFARCTDLGCTAPVITKIDTGGDVGLDSSLKMGADGFARISYYDASNGDLKFARCTDVDCTAPKLTTVDAGTDTETTKETVGSGSSLAIGSDGNARISYYDSENGRLKLARCTDSDCTTPTLTTVGPSAGVGGAQTSIDLGDDGFARISHWNLTSPALDYSLCGNAACTAPTNTTVDVAGSLGLGTGSGSSIIIASDGFARISYFGEGPIKGVKTGVIKYVQCTNKACTASNIIEIGSALFGASSSMSLAPDGFARISYYDGKNGVLKFVRCTSLGCTNPTITTVDDTPNDLTTDSDSGEFSSLVIGTDGLAKIAFFHRTDGDLKLAQCTNSDCTAVSIITIDR